MYIQMYGCAGYGYEGNAALCTASLAQPILGAFFFVSFVLFGTMIVLNLFIGVIMNGMTEAQKEYEVMLESKHREATNTEGPSLEHELFTLTQTMQQLSGQMEAIRARFKNEFSERAKRH